MKLRVILEPSDEGGYTVYVPSLPGCISIHTGLDDTSFWLFVHMGVAGTLSGR